ncbi:uncharacterized protein LOC143844255 [Paroedura picta]|uniref:uncharacterized protein LOC143844255 n=1 Tax=Paroedura picta TaxID=143630 RepID=UPI004056E90B
MEELTKAQLFHLLCKGNSEILKAVNKLEKEIRGTKGELLDGAQGPERPADDAAQLTVNQVKLQCLEVNQLEGESARDVKTQSIFKEPGKTDSQKESTKNLEVYSEQEMTWISKIKRVYSKATATRKLSGDISVQPEEEIQIDKGFRVPSKAITSKNQVRDFSGPDRRTIRNTLLWKKTQFHFLRPPER